MDFHCETTSFQRLKMDKKNKIPILFSLILFINCVSGIPEPDQLEVNVSDGEVTVLWKHPKDAPSNSSYNVEMAKYNGGDWKAVSGCMRTTRHYCHLTSLINDYITRYKIRVQLVAGSSTSAWTIKRFLANKSDLLPPSFTLWATSSTLTIYVHEKPILKKLFPYGVTYTIYLEEIGKENKTTIAYLKDDGEEKQREKTFTSLHWGRKYCVRTDVEGNGATSKSGLSPQQCMHLPEQEWFIIATSSLSLLGVLAVVAIMGLILLCYLTRPAKTPTVLKSPVREWLPLSVAEGAMEVVTDKGWFLSSYGTETKNCIKLPVTHLTVTKDCEEDRRTSTDSGVSMEPNSATDNGGTSPMRQEDSGCGSMGGSESSTSGQTDYPIKDERTETNEAIVRKTEDSGVGMGSLSSSINMDEQESEPLMKFVTLRNYRSQNTSVVQSHDCDNENMFNQIPTDCILAEVVTGYRAGPQSCICSGAGQCTWCHKHIHYRAEEIKQYRPLAAENGLLSSNSDLIDSQKGGVTFSGYSSKTGMDTAMMNDLHTSILQISQTFPLLASLPLANFQQDFNMNNLPLSLCDVQLTSD